MAGGAGPETRSGMDNKKLLSTILLFAIAVGFSIASFVMIKTAHSRADVIQGLIYAIPGVVSFGALIALPFKQT
jgi:hypothetical protein